jgi:hypothetical protein
MRAIEYRTQDKSEWGPGPWQDEPDKAQWTDKATGLPCLIVRNSLGALCGYVGVAEGHPLFGKSYEDAGDLDVHGGITFTNFCHEGVDEALSVCHRVEPGENDRVWWLGFDCSHLFDLYPVSPLYLRAGNDGTIYRDLAYVRSECASLARQLREMDL